MQAICWLYFHNPAPEPDDNDQSHTQEQLMRKLPALARYRCLQAMQVRLDALPTPEFLKTRGMDPTGAQAHANECREAPVELCEEMQAL